MRAIILATGSRTEMTIAQDKMPACMLPLVDKPFVQHLVEYLIVKGVTTIDFVLSRFPEQLEDLLGDGMRWGAKFSFHLARDAEQPMKTVRLVSRTSGEPVLLADADFLPPAFTAGIPSVDESPILWMDGDRDITDAARWTGWALCPAQALANLPDTAMRADVFDHLREAGGAMEGCSDVLSAASFDRLIDAQTKVIDGWQEDLVLTGSRRSGGIVIGRGARIHPAAEMTGPLYIGEFSEIGESVRLERGTVIGRDCVIDSGCRVRESIILPGTYVGKDLDVVGCVADQGALHNARIGTEVKITDDFLLGRITPGDGFTRSSTIASRITAGLLLFFLWPLLLLAIVFRAASGNGDALFRKRLLRLPAPADPQAWRFFDRIYVGDPSDEVKGKLAQILRVDLPGLINVARGEMHLVGSPGRTREEVLGLEPEWREIYLKSKVGLVTEVRVRCGYTPEKEEQHASDTFYAVNASRRYDMKLLGDFVRNQFRPHRG